MRRLPGILFVTGATLVVIVALLVSGLRLVLPHLNNWRPALLEKISASTGAPVEASYLQASWQNFGPTLEVRDIKAGLKDGGEITVKRVTLALDVWQSLLHARWQFRDLTFYQLNIRTNTPFMQNEGGEPFQPNRISDLFLRQFDHFDLRDSTISFLTLSGQRAELAIPKLTWLNDRARHRAEGLISLSSLTDQHGTMQLRMDLRDDDGLLSNGTVWMQADDVDVKPWLGKWMTDNVSLSTAQFSLAAWVNIRKGDIADGDIWLKRGGASWEGNARAHHLQVDNLTAHLRKEGAGWQLDIPRTNITLDDTPWPPGALTLAWLPGQDVGGTDRKSSDELRIRANNLELQGLNGLIPITAKLSPSFGEVWDTLKPRGHLNALALDIPLEATEQTRFQGQWDNLSWNQWKLMPGAENFSGTLSGSVGHGRITAAMKQAKMPYQGVFRAPLEIADGKATLEWRKDASGFTLEGKDIDVKATAVHARGGFRYQQPVGDEPWLSILAGIRTDDASQAWRYFPENLMGKPLVDYLSGAIQGGQVDNATLVYGGNPSLFPYYKNEGQFEVLVPVRNATFAFQPDWPALKGIDIVLDFINDGLWMKAPQASLGGVQGRNITANIPDYQKEMLLIDADISGPGKAVGPYFKETPLDDSLAAALDELQLDGDVNARLHLDIPLTGEQVTAKGDVLLNNNSLFIKPLDSTVHNLSGKFSFVNGDLQSEPMRATWFNQPLNLDFNTRQGDKAYQVGINLNANWQPTRTGLLPKPINDALSGRMPWEGKVGITLPYKGSAQYDVEIHSDLKEVSSRLPSPANKAAGAPLPLAVNVKGDLKGFTLSGNAGDSHQFNSRWLLKNKLTLDRGIWVSDSKTLPPLPDAPGVELNLPALNGAEWLALFQHGAAGDVSSATQFPSNITLRTPALTLGGQQWNNVSIISRSGLNGNDVAVQGREINATLAMNNTGPWLAKINYLYFNPVWSAVSDPKTPANPLPDEQINFSGWPDVQLRCAECWFWGQKFGRIDGDFAISGDKLTLTNGLIDTGFAKLTTRGEWVNRVGEPRTSLKGVLKGKKIDAAADFFGITTPIQGSSFDVDYDLHWRDVPWKPSEKTLNGILHTRLGKGQIEDLGTGHAGQLLRLVSFDALLRKLRFDFSDTFGDGFYFDSIRSTAWIKDGVLHTDDTLVDGLEADIAMKGSIDLVRRKLDIEAIVAPEISATVGVATAFAVNPIVGAAVFAASKVLGPLWSKISVLRYQISGPLDKPQINEVLRQPRAEKAQ